MGSVVALVSSWTSRFPAARSLAYSSSSSRAKRPAVNASPFPAPVAPSASVSRAPLCSQAISVFIRGDGYGGAGKGERGASNPTQPRRQACESAGATSPAPRSRIRPSSTPPCLTLTETLPPLRGERQDKGVAVHTQCDNLLQLEAELIDGDAGIDLLS